MTLNSRFLIDAIAGADPKLPLSYPDSCHSAKPRFFEVVCRKAVIGVLTQSAKGA